MNHKKRDYLLLLLLLIVGLSVGYALLQANLKINGTSKIRGNTWDIHFENLNVTSGSVSIGTGDVAATIQSSRTDVSYSITLNEPGDFYEFTVDAVNEGSINGMIESVTSKLNNQPITTLPNYLNYSVTYSDGIDLAPNHFLKAGETETYKVRIEFKKDISSSDLPTTVQTLTLDFGVVYIQADNTAIEVPHVIPDIVYSVDSVELGILYKLINGKTTDYTTLNKNVFLRHELNSNGQVIRSDVCYLNNNTLYCMIGTSLDENASSEYESPHYESNRDLLLELFGPDAVSNNTCVVTESEYVSSKKTECQLSNLSAHAYNRTDGSNWIKYDNYVCETFIGGDAYCYNE